jgi:hypothetical protein
LIPTLASDEDIFTNKQITSVDYILREEEIREEIQLGQQAYKDREGVMVFSFGTDETEF